jgi:vancomycin resistance protein YoaR
VDAVAPSIRELIERVTTSYAGGSAERRYNVELAAQRINGVIVPPGGIFSFNDEVGEVSYRSGYKRGWGISRDESGGVVTIPSEGGGICQVATTVFHAVFWSGYQIVERNWHGYWIPRYGLPPKGMKGLDATIDQVYDKDGRLVSETDLRFKNNTDAPLLLQARFDGKTLTVSLFGTKPDWQVKIDAPKIEKVVKADTTPVRQTDPSLAAGTELQIESAQDGFQATIVRTVSRVGKVLEQRSFVSTYRPSRNVFVSGPKPGTPAPN